MNNQTSTIGLAILAAISTVPSMSNAQTKVSQACSPSLDSDLFTQWEQTVRDVQVKPSEEAYLQSVRTLISQQCDSAQLSPQDVKEIVEAAQRINAAEPARDTNSLVANTGSITKLVRVGLNHALHGICASDLGALGAVRHCVCTSIVINDQAGFNTDLRRPDCR